MIKIFSRFLLILIFSIIYAKDTYKISGTILDLENNGLKKASVTLLNQDGDNVKDTKSKRNGKFEIKKITPGSYTLRAEEKDLGIGLIQINLTNSDLQIDIVIPSSIVADSKIDPDKLIENDQTPPKGKFEIKGIVTDQNGKAVNKAEIVLKKNDGKKVKSIKSKKNGSFNFKKINSDKYIIEATHKKHGKGFARIKLWGQNENLKIIIPSEFSPEDDSDLVTDKNDDSKRILTDQSQTELDSLPQQRDGTPIPKLQLGELFFEYESNLKKLQSEIDSLKTVVQSYDQKQKMPNISPELLDLIYLPKFQHRIELQNGTVVLGDILDETDSSLTLSTQIGRLVLKKDMVIRMDEQKLPAPKVEFLGDPFIDYYPDKQVFSGSIKNVGEKRADFVRVVGNLWDQTTSPAGTDSIFIRGTKVIYDSEVIADTALEPGQIATYKLIILVKRGIKPQYHTMDIHWEETQ
tara:strand:- start:360 stop:1751 length:1392 start_codon:yes stop_codon:yes gene_type:complete